MAVWLTSASPAAPAGQDTPRPIVARLSTGDLIFRAVLRGAGISVLVITGMILLFLLLRSTWALKTAGLSFLTSQNWVFVTGSYSFGIGGVLPDTIEIAVIALAIGVPVAVGTAIFISEYAPAGLRRPLIAVIDLMAAIPSIIYGLWGRFFLMPRIIGSTSWAARHLSAVPVFKVPSASSGPSAFVGSPAIAGMVVSLMVIPIVTSLSMAAGLVLFSMTLIVNSLAAIVINRSRSGAATAD